MNSIARRRFSQVCKWAVLACISGSSLTWAGPPAKKAEPKVSRAEAKAPAPLPARTESKSAAQSSAANTVGPGLPVGPNSNYAVQVPAVSVESTCPMRCNVGKPMEHQILVKNLGSSPAEQIEVRTTFSLECSFLSTQPKAEINGSTLVWRLPRLDAEAQQKLTVQLKPQVPGELSSSSSVTFTTNYSLKTQVGQPKLKLVCEGPKDTVIGTDAHLMLTVINIGSGTASGVRVRQDLPNGIKPVSHGSTPAQLDMGTLEPGESRFVQTLAPARERGAMRIALVAESDDGVKATVEHSLRVRAPKLELTTTGPDFRYLNRKGTYQFTLSNPGDAPATNVNLVVELPEGLQFLEASSGGAFNQQKRVVEWSIGIIEAEQDQELSVTVAAKKEGEHRQRAVAWADNNLRVTTDKITRVGSTPSIVMEVVDLDDPIEIGNTTTYEIRIANRGTKAAEQVQVIATLPDGVDTLGAEGAKYRTVGRQIVFDALPSLGAQAATALKVKVKGTKAGTVRFRAELTSPSLTDTVTAEQLTEVYGE